MLQRGVRIDERFEVEMPVGAGGMGMVYRAKLLDDGTPVALKVLRRNLTDSAQQRFEREARILAELNHPAIVGYVGQGVLEDGSAYLAMEWLHGETLKARLKRGSMSVDDALAVAERLTRALAAAHARDIIHRDLKPANVLLVGGDVNLVKLLDFGIARETLAHSELTQTGVPIGTPAYMSPEQVRGERDIDVRSDLYSLGCLLFRCLAGRTPLVASDAVAMLTKVVLEDPPAISELRPDVPEGLATLLAELLDKRKEARPDSAEQVCHRLASIERSSGTQRVMEPNMLTGAERTVRCLILVGSERAPSPDTTLVTPSRRSRGVGGIEQRVAQHGGTVHALADGSMVVTLTGAAAATDLAARAARCALVLRPLFPAVPMALATGRAEDSVDSLIGDVIERGAAALRHPSHEAVRVDELTAGLLRPRFELTSDEHGPVLLRELAPLASDVSGLRSRPCVGRDRELALLDALIHDSSQEPLAQVALLTGEAGIGKSRLLAELLARVEARAANLQVWIGMADPMHSDTPLYAIGQALRHGLNVDDGAPLVTQRRRLLSSLATLVPARDVERVAAFVGEAVGVHFPDEQTPALRAARNDDALCREHIQRALLQTLAAVAERAPLMLIIEDVHWCSSSTVQLIDTALRQLSGCALFVLATARPEVHQRFRNLWQNRHYQEVRLHGLRRSAARELVLQALGDQLAEAAIERLVDGADGNPFYLEALLREAAEGKLDDFPDTVLTAASAELERLPTDARRLLRAASVFGSSFAVAAVLALLGPEERRHGVDGVLQLLAERDIISEQRLSAPGQYLFRHALYRQAAYAMLTERDRQLAHRLAARFLQRAGEQNAILIAEHLERGAHIGKSLVWYERAARQALRSDDLDKAAKLVDRALAAAPDTPRRGRLLWLKSEVHRWRGANSAAQRASVEAMDCFEAGSSWWFGAAGQAAAAASKLGAIDDLIGVVAQMVKDPPQDIDMRYLQAAARAATPLLAAGRYPLVAELLEPVAGMSPPSSADPGDHGWLQRARSLLAWCRGDVADYLRASRAAVTAFEAAEDARNACSLRIGIGIGALQVGDWDGASEALAQVRHEGEQRKMAHFEAVALYWLARVQSERGERLRAIELLREAAEDFRGLVDTRNEGAARVELGRLLLEADQRSDAQLEISAALALSRGWDSAMPYALAVQAALLIEQGKLAHAASSAARAHQHLLALGRIEHGESFVRYTYARSLELSGDQRGFETAVEQGKRNLQARAARITDVDMRRGFLSRVADNRLLATLATSLG